MSNNTSTQVVPIATLDSECPHCHTVYEVSPQEIGSVAVCIKCNKKFTVARKPISPEEVLAQQIKAWEEENSAAEVKWQKDVVLWEQRVAALKKKYQEDLIAYDRCKLNYVENLQEGGLLCKCEDDFEFSLKPGEVVYRRVFNVSLEESRGVRRTESHRSSQRSVDWSDDYNGRKRRLGDSYGYDGKSESKTDYQFQPIDTGNVYVTNKRFLFIGQQQQRNLSFDKILSFDYDWRQEGGSFRVRAENRQRAMRFTGGNFYEFALVMKVIREPDFRGFLLSGPQEEVKKWLDGHNAFPNWMTPNVPKQPNYQGKPGKPRPRPRPTLTLPQSNCDSIDWGENFGAVFSAIGTVLMYIGWVVSAIPHLIGAIFMGLCEGASGKYSSHDYGASAKILPSADVAKVVGGITVVVVIILLFMFF